MRTVALLLACLALAPLSGCASFKHCEPLMLDVPQRAFAPSAGEKLIMDLTWTACPRHPRSLNTIGPWSSTQLGVEV